MASQVVAESRQPNQRRRNRQTTSPSRVARLDLPVCGNHPTCWMMHLAAREVMDHFRRPAGARSTRAAPSTALGDFFVLYSTIAETDAGRESKVRKRQGSTAYCSHASGASPAGPLDLPWSSHVPIPVLRLPHESVPILDAAQHEKPTVYCLHVTPPGVFFENETTAPNSHSPQGSPLK